MVHIFQAERAFYAFQLSPTNQPAQFFFTFMLKEVLFADDLKGQILMSLLHTFCELQTNSKHKYFSKILSSNKSKNLCAKQFVSICHFPFPTVRDLY